MRAPEREEHDRTITFVWATGEVSDDGWERIIRLVTTHSKERRELRSYVSWAERRGAITRSWPFDCGFTVLERQPVARYSWRALDVLACRQALEFDPEGFLARVA